MLEKVSTKIKDEDTRSLLQKLYIIILHLKLNHTNIYEHDLGSHVAEYLDLIMLHLRGEGSLINSDAVVVLLYNCLKIIVGFN